MPSRTRTEAAKHLQPYQRGWNAYWRGEAMPPFNEAIGLTQEDNQWRDGWEAAQDADYAMDDALMPGGFP